MIRQQQVADRMKELIQEGGSPDAIRELFTLLVTSLGANKKKAIKALMQNPDGITAKEVAGLVGASHQYACNLLTDLESLGLAMRERPPYAKEALWRTTFREENEC